MKVLVLEDDAVLRSSTSEILRELGHQPFEATDAEEARSLLEQHPFEVLIADVGLPGTSGDVFAAEARMMRPDIRVIFATGQKSIPNLNGDRTSPVLLRKPYDFLSLTAALKIART